MSAVNSKKQEYENAQKLGESVERMCNEEGWKEYFIPMIKKKRAEAQNLVNSVETDFRIADFNRGLIAAYDFVIGYEDEKKNQAMSIMVKNSTKANGL